MSNNANDFGMYDVFELQEKLNIKVFEKHSLGVDGNYLLTINDEKNIPIWIENYRKALSSELAELCSEYKRFGIHTQNAKVEIVDMLHFVVSLSHIAKIRYCDIPEYTFTDNRSVTDLFMDGFLILNDIQNSVKWKWWAKGGEVVKFEKFKDAVFQFWKLIFAFCRASELGLYGLLSGYRQKNIINIERQNNEYNEDTKTDSDNESIKF